MFSSVWRPAGGRPARRHYTTLTHPSDACHTADLQPARFVVQGSGINAVFNDALNDLGFIVITQQVATLQHDINEYVI
jgi:hypothetical protein